MNSNAILAPPIPEMPIASGVIMDSRRNAHIASATELPIRSTEAASASYVTNAIWSATDIVGSSSFKTEGKGRHADKEHHTAYAQGEAYGRQAQSATKETQGKQSMVITLKVRCPLSAVESQELSEVIALKTKQQNPDKANEEKPEDMQSSTPPQAANSSTRTMITRSLAATVPTLVPSEAESSTARASRPRPRPEKKRRTEDFDEEPRHKYKRLKR